MKNRRRRSVRGAALMEFAICLPVFFMITMATIETCRMVYLRQSLKITAYECARIGIVPGITLEAIQDQCDLILLSRNIHGYQLTCTPEDPTTLQYGELFTVNLQMPAERNALVGSWFYRGKMFSESVSIMAEY